MDQVGLFTFQLFIVYCGQPNWFFYAVDVNEFYMVSVNREKLLSHFWMQFWTRHFVVLLPCWLLVAVGNQLLWVYQLLELLLWGTMLFRHTNIFVAIYTPISFRTSLENYLCRYSNIFVTAPSPENLKTLFEFICKGFEALDYKVQILSSIDSYYH